jgi:hypothetical protein
MHKAPDNWKNATREGAGRVNHPGDDLRLTKVREHGGPEERRTRQINFRGTESLKATITRLAIAHGICAYELMALAVIAFEEKYGSGSSGRQP